MANLSPNSSNHTGYRRTLALTAAALIAIVSINAWSQGRAPELQPDMPITIDADSSEFDYASNRLVFRKLRLDQGNLGIEADLAETDKLDFNDGQWVFSGNVVVDADSTRLSCDRALLTFVNHQLSSAELTGRPAKFEQRLEESGDKNSGEANSIIYNLSSGTLQLKEDARFSDGSNEISGALITYDLIARNLTAGSGDSGPVKIIIEPGQVRELKKDQ
jgi:lipopolysaccharide export system protein LptA